MHVHIHTIRVHMYGVCTIRRMTYDDDATIWVIGFFNDLGYFDNSSILRKVVIFAD